MSPPHTDLVAVAARWLRGTANCNVVFAEPTVFTDEMPDAIGWRGGQSLVVECKTSRQDALAEPSKKWRQFSQGMGNLRYILAPRDVAQTLGGWLAETFPHYGLLSLVKQRVFVLIQAAYRDLCPWAMREERLILVQSFDRITGGRQFSKREARFELWADYTARTRGG